MGEGCHSRKGLCSKKAYIPLDICFLGLRGFTSSSNSCHKQSARNHI